jgi:adenylate cyclase
VNLASRLEGLNKYYGTSILASETIFQASHEEFEFRLLDRVAVKGKTKGITIYELLGPRSLEPRKPHIVSYEQAFNAYSRAEFRQALKILGDVSKTETQDLPSIVLAERCRRYLEDPPKEWTGLHTFTAK